MESREKVTEKGFNNIYVTLCENMKSKEALDYMLEKFEIIKFEEEDKE